MSLQSRDGLVVAVLLILLSPAIAAAQLGLDGNQRFDQGDLGNLVEAGDRFAAALAAGDFDNDGFEDLAIGLPNEDVGSVVDAGSVLVVYGSAAGLNLGSRGPISIHQDVTQVQDVAETGDHFGATLVVGDFNNDGWDDLVVAVPFEDLEGAGGVVRQTDAGALHVFPGGIAGIVPAADDFFTAEAFLGIFGDDQFGMELGSAMAIGDYFNNEPNDDIIVGIPGLNGASVDQGYSTGLDPPTGPPMIQPDGWDLPYGRFGAAVAMGNINEIFDTIVVGAPEKRQGIFGPLRAGALWVLSRACYPEAATFYGGQENQLYGAALAMGDFRGAGYEQIVIGSPGLDVAGQEAAGSVRILDLGSGICDGGLIFSDSFTQGAGGMGDAAEPFDRLGEVVGVGDFNGDGIDDAVFGVPGENLFDGTPGVDLDAGLVHVVYGDPSGIDNGEHQTWTFNDFGLASVDNDHFGGAVAAGDFNGDGADDLAVGAPDAEWDGQPGTGLLQIIYGFSPSIFADGFESSDASAWSVTVP